MNRIDYDALNQFDLIFPGYWIENENRKEAFQTKLILDLIRGLFTEAVASYALFQPVTGENVKELIGKNQSSYERCLNGLYAKAFVFALDGIEKLLSRLVVNHKPSEEIKLLHNEYKKTFGHLKHIRDSAIHIEDRGRGKTRRQEQLNTHVIVIGGFCETRYTFTGEDGKQYEIEISESTLNAAKLIIQKIIELYAWM